MFFTFIVAYEREMDSHAQVALVGLEVVKPVNKFILQDNEGLCYGDIYAQCHVTGDGLVSSIWLLRSWAQ